MAKQQEAEAQAVKLEVRAYPIAEPKNNTLAFASVTINDLVAIHGIRVMDSEKGKFAAMPSMKGTDGKYHDMAHPVTGDLRKQLNTAVLQAYEEAVQEKASVRDQIKDGAKAAKEAPAPDKAKAAKKAEPDR